MFIYGFCVRIRLLRMFVYSFCARCADFSNVYGLYFAQVVRILRTYTDFVHIEWLCILIRLIF